jgi:hypothetical protein
MTDHWLRAEHATESKCFAVAFVGTRVQYGAPLAMAIVRRNGLHDVRVLREHLERRGFRCEVLRGHDGPCCFVE